MPGFDIRIDDFYSVQDVLCEIAPQGRKNTPDGEEMTLLDGWGGKPLK